MSFISDQIRRIDSQLDRLFALQAPSPSLSPVVSTTSELLGSQDDTQPSGDYQDLNRIIELQLAIKSLSTTASSHALLQPVRIRMILEQADLTRQTTSYINGTGYKKTPKEQDLEWLLVSKATAQTYGQVLNILLEQTIPLNRDMWYWDEVLGYYVNTVIYTVQTSPWRLWEWSNEIYNDAWRRLQNTVPDDPYVEAISISSRWMQFYNLVKDSIRERSLLDMQFKPISPLVRCRAEAKNKQSHLKRFHGINACGLGVLMNEGLSFDVADDGSLTNTSGSDEDRNDWRSRNERRIVIAKSVTLMEAIIRNVTVLEHGTSDFEETVFTTVEHHPDTTESTSDSTGPEMIAYRLRRMLENHIPLQIARSQHIKSLYGRPSRIVRYWLPAAALLLSSSTLLRIFVNRKAEILTSIRELGATSVDFWSNWVVDPVKKVIGTIRHDEGSEIAIMSKESLEGDRASLERMVVDFARDNPNTSTGEPLNEADLAVVRAKVREGDLTPVLRAYEKDLRKPFIGTIRGELIRALLIQVQKTKVDVEVALGGIDALLKSQELVFGFVGLTPGVLVCLGLFRWLGGAIEGRKGGAKAKKQGHMIRVLRNIDRILSASDSTNNGGMLSYKEHGMLLCEAHVLRQRAQRVLPGEIYTEFLEEINDLVNIRTGVERQVRVVDRIRWAYGKWLK